MQTNAVITTAMHDLTEDTVYVRIATITNFIHAFIFNVLILYYLIEYSDFFSPDTVLWWLVHEYLSMLKYDSSMLIWLLLVGIILFIGYELLPPIGDAAMVYYLEDKKPKDGFRALAKWLYKFFPMFEFNLATSLFKMSFIMLVIVRLVLFGLIDNLLILILMGIWMSIALFVNLLLPYSKLIICLEGEWFFDAMKKSVAISINNLWITGKFVIINFILSIRFFINMLIIVGIPVWLIYVGVWLWLTNITFLNYLFMIILVWLIFFVAYIEGLIEWFFTAARWRIYKDVEQI